MSTSDMPSMSVPHNILDCLAYGAEVADRESRWPAESWDALRTSGILGRAIAREFGGSAFEPVELAASNEALTTACMTTAFVLSQRDAAVRLLLNGPEHHKQRHLPRLAAGEEYMTVGLSQLTTSRSSAHALRAVPDGRGFRLTGTIPWVTGADQATAIVVGAPLEDGRQILLVLPTQHEGVHVGPPLALAALQGSRTSAVHCEGAVVDPEMLMAGPTQQVLSRGAGGGLDTSCIAIGLAAASTTFLRTEADKRPDMGPAAERFEAALTHAREQLHRLVNNPGDPDAAWALRIESTRLALRASQAALAAAKGAGFLAGQPAQRWARQALFFLVWSCPRTVSDGVLADLLP
jgi:butyryl-CoA dehydrogenase